MPEIKPYKGGNMNKWPKVNKSDESQEEQMPEEDKTEEEYIAVSLKHMKHDVWIEMRQYRLVSGLRNMEELIEKLWRHYQKDMGPIRVNKELLEALVQILDVEPDTGKMNRLAKIEGIASAAIRKATEP